jgi:hypothetical protein
MTTQDWWEWNFLVLNINPIYSYIIFGNRIEITNFLDLCSFSCFNSYNDAFSAHKIIYSV